MSDVILRYESDASEIGCALICAANVAAREGFQTIADNYLRISQDLYRQTASDRETCKAAGI